MKRSYGSCAGATSTRSSWQPGRTPPTMTCATRSRSGRATEKVVDAWREGRTGYPVVDAGMRQLLREGWMHNRTRMVVASFLTKDLMIDWRIGAAHFMAHLVDGDVAQNQLNWQWVAGTGTDTNPHRVYNPTVQSRKIRPRWRLHPPLCRRAREHRGRHPRPLTGRTRSTRLSRSPRRPPRSHRALARQPRPLMFATATCVSRDARTRGRTALP